MKHRTAITLTAIISLGIATGCGSTKVVTRTKTAYRYQTITATSTAVQTQTVTHRVHSGLPQTVTVTQTAAPASTTTAAAPISHGGSSFSGNGEKSIGTVKVSQQSTLAWTCAGCDGSFSILSNGDSNGDLIAVSSSATHGTTSVSPGSYGDVDVITEGNWTITVRP